MHGAYVKTPEGNVKFAAQVYANDMVFFSECPEGIFEMVQVLNEFNQWSRMEFNMPKCAKALHIYDENKRPAYLKACFRFRGEDIPNLTRKEWLRDHAASIVV
jgi:hypothetical protein